MSQKKLDKAAIKLADARAEALAQSRARIAAETALQVERDRIAAAAVVPPPTPPPAELVEYKRLSVSRDPVEKFRAGQVLVAHPHLLGLLEAERGSGNEPPPRAA